MPKEYSRSDVKSRTHRLIASKHPTIGIFDDLTNDPEELKAGFILEAMTNDRHLLLSSRIKLIPNEEVAVGPTASLVMAAFLHADDNGRFHDDKLGAWYASLSVETAIRETLYHNERRLSLSDGAFPSKIQMRELVTTINLNLVDIRDKHEEFPELYAPLPEDYQSSQAFANKLRWPNDPEVIAEKGIIYDSVRDNKGTNICIFWPSLVPLPVNQGDHYEYNWDADGNSQILKLTNIDI